MNSIDNTELSEELRVLFKKLQHTEKTLYSLWNQNDPLYSQQVKTSFYRKSFKKYQQANGRHWLDFHHKMLKLQPLTTVLQSDAMLSAAFGLNSLISPILRTKEWIIPKTIYIPWLIGKKILGKNAFSTNDTEANWQKAGLAVSTGALAFSVGLGAIFSIPKWKGAVAMYTNFVHYIRKRFSPLRECTIILKQIYTTLKKHPVLLNMCDPTQSLQSFAAGTIPEQKLLMKTIFHTVFQSTSTSLHQHLGTVLHAVPLFLAAKNSFAPLFAAVGTCEALVSLASLFNEKQTSKTPWCFPSYIEKDRPYINIMQYVHPLIPSDNAISNSLELGKTYQGLIVTGPNKSGKSINIRAIMLCVLCAQTIGIVPAQHMVLTPITKIMSYLNPIDNLAEGKSLFQAESERIKEIVDAAYALQPQQFSLVVTDELLSGTAPTEGEAASWGIAYGLAQLPNCMPIMATHFAKLTSLPAQTNNFFANYHVEAIKNLDGSFTHPFKLKPGKSHQVIALDLARTVGMDTDILDAADAFLTRKGFKRGRTL